MLYHAQFKLIAKLLGDEQMELGEVGERLEGLLSRQEHQQHVLTHRLGALER